MILAASPLSDKQQCCLHTRQLHRGLDATANAARLSAEAHLNRLLPNFGLKTHLRRERRLAIAFPASARGMSKDWDLQCITDSSSNPTTPPSHRQQDSSNPPIHDIAEYGTVAMAVSCPIRA